jgi:hypothetical protein
MPLRRSLLAFSILASLACASADAASPAASPPPPPHLWSGLIYATNPSHPAPAPGRLARYVEKLRRIFGYSQYDLVGESSNKIDGPTERWLMPSQDFYMSVKPENGPGGHYPARVTLFQAKRRVAEFETHLSPDSPLFIRGPQYGGGQLVIVVHMVDEPEPTPAALILQRPGSIIVGGPGLGAILVHKEKGPGMGTISQKARIPVLSPIHPVPIGGPGPGSPDHFDPGLHDHLGPLPGGPGGLDSKLNRQ